MEYRTKVTAATTVLAVLCLAAVVGLVFNPQAVSQRQADQPLLPGFDPAAATGVELSGGVTLNKTVVWGLSVQGRTYPASGDRVDGYLKSLARLKRERLATTGDPAPFGLAQGFKTLKVTGAAGKVLADLEVGSLNDHGTKAYVRVAGSKDVWETDGSFSRSLGMDFNTWADLSLFPKKTPVRIAFDSRVETADKTVYLPFDLVRVEGKDGKAASWQNRLTKAPVDAAGWAENFALFRFTAFASPTDPPAAALPLGTLTVGWSDGSETKVSLGRPDTQHRYRSSDGTKDFWIADWALGQLLYK